MQDDIKTTIFNNSLIKSGSLLFMLCITILFGCEKKSLPPGCYKATVIAFNCAYTAKIEGANIGEKWKGIKNCVNISNLPSEARQVGDIVYFSTYKSAGGPYCTMDKTYDFPRTTIEMIDYSVIECPRL